MRFKHTLPSSPRSQRVLAADPAQQTLRVGSGMTVHELAEAAAARGMALPVSRHTALKAVAQQSCMLCM